MIKTIIVRDYDTNKLGLIILLNENNKTKVVFAIFSNDSLYTEEEMIETFKYERRRFLNLGYEWINGKTITFDEFYNKGYKHIEDNYNKQLNLFRKSVICA